MATTTVPCTMEPLTVVAARQQDLRLVAAGEQRASSVAMEHNKLASSPGATDFHTSESVSMAPLRGACWSVGKVAWWWHGNTERGEGEFSLMYQASILILVSSKANNYISILGFAFDVVQYPPHLETNVHRSLFYLDKLLKINLPKSSSWYCR